MSKRNKCIYTVEEQADIILSKWMHVTGYAMEQVYALSDALVYAIYIEAWEWSIEYINTSAREDQPSNPFDEYVKLMDTEMKRRGIV